MALVKALPQTRNALEAQRTLKRRATLVDLVDPVVVRLWEDEQFMKFVGAVEDGEAVEGSLDIDDTMAAGLIRQYATENNMPDVAKHKLSSLRYALRMAMRRYQVSRKQRVGEE